MILILIDIITNILLLWKINMVGIAALIVNVTWMTLIFVKYIKNPDFMLIKKVERHTYITELTMIVSVGYYLVRLGFK